jgi:hypothetical protein
MKVRAIKDCSCGFFKAGDVGEALPREEGLYDMYFVRFPHGEFICEEDEIEILEE